MKKKQETKQEKTVTAHEKAFKAAEKKTRLQLAQVSHFLTAVVYTCICYPLYLSRAPSPANWLLTFSSY